MTQQTATLTATDIVTLYRNAGSILASVNRAVTQLGIEHAESLLFTALPEHEVLVARPLDERVDGRSSTHGRALKRVTNSDGEPSAVRAIFPRDDVEAAFGFDANAIATTKAEGRRLALYTGHDDADQPLLAFADVPTTTVPTDALNDDP